MTLQPTPQPAKGPPLGLSMPPLAPGTPFIAQQPPGLGPSLPWGPFPPIPSLNNSCLCLPRSLESRG